MIYYTEFNKQKLLADGAFIKQGEGIMDKDINGKNNNNNVIDSRKIPVDSKKMHEKIGIWIFTYLLRPSVLGILVLFGLLCFVLYLNPVIGMGDDGSTAGVIAGSDLYDLGELSPQESMAYFQKDWGIRQYYNDATNIQITAQTPFILTGKRLDMAFTWDWLFDMRFYAAVITIFYLLAMYLLFETVTYGKRSKWTYAVVALGVVIFGDTAYTAWINSFYTQALSFFLIIILGTSLIVMGQEKLNDFLLVSLFFLSSLLFCLLNQQYAFLGVCLGILGFNLKYVNPRKRYKDLCRICGSLLIVVSLAGWIFMPNGLTNLSKYHSMTRGVLMTAENPETALEYFGINPQYAVLTGSSYYEEISPSTMNSSEMQNDFFKKFNPISVAVYYAGNPNQLYSMLNQAVDSSFNIRPSWLGNYEITQGYPPGAQTKFFTIWSTFKSEIMPGNFGFVTIWMGVIIVVYVRNFRTGIIEKNERNTLRFIGLMTWLFIGLWQLYFSIITSGDMDSLGRLFIFSLTFDLVSFVVLGKLIHWFEKKLRKVDWEAQKKIFFNKGNQDDQGGYR